MMEEETLTDYRRRLRVLVEDLVLAGIPKTLDEIFITWKKGLNPLLKHWLFLMERAFPNNGTAVETIYRFERLVIQRGGGIEIDNIAFIVSASSRRPDFPDFRIWIPIGRNCIYAHDIRQDHALVREDAAYEDDFMLTNVIRCDLPREVLMDKPAIIPEEDNQIQISDTYQTRMRQISAYKRKVTKELLDQKEGKKRRMEAEKYVSNFNYGPWIGTPQGGWIESDTCPPSPQAEKRPAPKGIIMTELTLATPGSRDVRIDISEDSSDEDEYPQLGPQEKGKDRLYPSP